MIGVLTSQDDANVFAEFFELFKTPWEVFQPGRRYAAVLLTTPTAPPADVPFAVVYHRNAHSSSAGTSGETLLSFQGHLLPIYGPTASYSDSQATLLIHAQSKTPALRVMAAPHQCVVEVGYDLVAEIRRLLGTGQPAANAACPALDLHIALLRELILQAGLPLVEIPPVPSGHPFLVCLTHDIDHPVLRNHQLDPTMAGYLFRATIGSLVDFCQRRRSFRELVQNWLAAVRLPLVFAGLSRDPWARFDQYIEIEKDCHATYFAIPFPNRPGLRTDGAAPAKRACRYSLSDIKTQLEHARAAGCEVSVHGIDAWLDQEAGREERLQLKHTIPTCDTGIRMHWLYFGENSFSTLEAAGYTYDSTFGYNETVGYRAGTTQVYRPLSTGNILELPLHIMDTALFYPSYLHLRPADARKVVDAMIDDAGRMGGVLTLNWHDRSIAPERLWTAFYVETLRRLKEKQAWFPSSAEAVGWFRKRRDARIAVEPATEGSYNIRASAPVSSTPPLVVRAHRARQDRSARSFQSSGEPDFVDTPLNQSLSVTLDL